MPFERIGSSLIRFAAVTSVLFLLLSSPRLILGQGTTASISGKVADESGAVVPGVTVIVTNVATGVARSLVTDDAGVYRAPALEVGSYEIKAELAGFQTSIRTGIELTVGRNAIVDMALKVGQVSEQVTVTGEASLVETREATLAGVVTTKSIEDLPLNGRNFVQLALLEIGVTNALKNSSAAVSTIRGFGIDLTVSGARPTSNSFLLDGADINDHRNKMPGSIAGVTLGVDSVREFRMMTTNFSAEFGRAGGGIITAITKSGTNEFHGSLFEFLRNSALDARNFFSPKKDPFKRNQFGGSIGGPIVKDQTFFFTNYEGLRDRLGVSNIVNVPDENARLGILPGRAPIQVPPVLKPYLAYLWPLPNGRNFGNGIAEHLFSYGEPTDENYIVGKVDHNFSQNQALSIRYTLDSATALKGFDTHAYDKYTTRNQYVTLEQRAILTPKLLNVARFSFIRSTQGDDNALVNPPDPSLYFIPEAGQMGSVGVSGLTNLINESVPRYFAQNVYQYSDAVTYNTGSHSFKFGADLKRYQYNGLSVSRFGGRWAFNSLVDLLQLNARQIESQLPGGDFRRGLRNLVTGLYLQDDFQMRSNFTLNVGLRYEFITVPSEVNGKYTNLRHNTDTQLSLDGPFFPNPSLRNFAPRIGFAWNPFGDGKTAIRSAFGIFDDQIQMVWFQQPIFRMPPATTVTIPNPPFPNPFARGVPSLNDLIALRQVTIQNFPWGSIKNPYLMKWNLNIQREIVPGTVATVGYIGSRGVSLGRVDQADLVQPEILPDGRRFFPGPPLRPIRNPTWSGIESRTTGANSFYHAIALKIERRFAAGMSLQGSYTFSKSVDDISTVTVANEFPGGTLQGTVDAPQAMRGRSEFDIRHNFVINGSWALPGPGQGGLAVALLGGWQLNGILTMSTGYPLTASIGAGWILDGGLGQAQLYTADLKPGGDNDPVLGGPDKYFDPTQFALPSRNFYGNAGRNTITSPSMATLDFSLTKKWALPFLGKEGKNLEFRSEFFNILNHANFGGPSNLLFNGSGAAQSSAGRINNTTTTGRQVQFALKITF